MQIIIILAISDFMFSTLWKKYELFITDLIFTSEVFINESILITKMKSREIKWMAEKVYNQLLNFHSVGSLSDRVFLRPLSDWILLRNLFRVLVRALSDGVLFRVPGDRILFKVLSPLFAVCPFFYICEIAQINGCYLMTHTGCLNFKRYISRI